MPKRLCCRCKRLQTVAKKEWTSVNYFGDWVCSSRCLEEWIYSHDTDPHRLETPLENAIPLGWKLPDFKSKYEEYFAAWLDKKKIVWHYERWGFKVGEKKRYTPDWYLPWYGCFLETKGAWGLGQKKKLIMFIQQYPELSFIVVPWIMKKEFYREDEIIDGVGVR